MEAMFDIFPWLNSYTFIISAVSVVLLISWRFNMFTHHNNLPPGPCRFPLIGCIPSLAYIWYQSDEEPQQMLAKMANQYGEVFCLHVGQKVIVVVNGYKSISEAFKNPLLNDRPISRLSVETGLDNGIGSASGKSWSTQRKITMSIFRNFGVGRNSFEGSISTEAQHLVDLMSANNNSSFDPRIMIGNCVSNITCAVTFGKRYEYADPEFEHILNAFSKIMSGSGATIMEISPVLRFIFPFQYHHLKSAFSDIYDLMDNLIKEHEVAFDESNLSDFIDVFLNEIELNKNNESNQYINHQSLIATCFNLFIAGTETTTSTLRWLLLYMIMYPDVQKKVQKELDDVIGRDRMPQWSDRHDVPYTQSVLLEVQRIRTIAPLGVPHVAAKDTTLFGYDIPKDAYVLSNIWAVHNDPDLWPEPDQFNPERFLDHGGKFHTREELIPFSTGQRICPGKNLANMDLFIFFTHMLYKFNVRKASPEHCYSLKGISGITYCPTPYEIVAEIRDD